ncbi:MAG: hypothetical protein JXA67_17970 [Micromonosporaceae bacterium]|nr:hypothetical protein [Micromonosporaceae bacterium]
MNRSHQDTSTGGRPFLGARALSALFRPRATGRPEASHSQSPAAADFSSSKGAQANNSGGNTQTNIYGPTAIYIGPPHQAQPGQGAEPVPAEQDPPQPLTSATPGQLPAPVPSSSQRLGRRERHRLRDALLATPSLDDPDVLRALAERLGLPAAAGTHHPGTYHSRKLVTRMVCFYPPSMQWEQLGYLIEETTGEAPPLDLREMLYELDYLGLAVWDQLRRILSPIQHGVMPADIRMVADRALDIVLDEFPAADLLRSLAFVKCEQMSIDAVPPVVVFLEHLAAVLDSRSRQALCQWTDRAARCYAIPADALTAIRTAATDRAATDVSRCIVIRADEHGRKDGHYRLSILIYAPPSPYPLRVLQGETDAFHREANLEKKHLHLVQQAVAELDASSYQHAWVEFSAPVALLDHAIETWPIHQSGSDLLGTWAALVVRARGRRNHPWQQRWTRLCDGHGQMGLVCQDTPPGRPDVIPYRSIAQVRSALRDNGQDVMLLALEFPGRTHRRERIAALTAAVDAGIPAVMWRRNGPVGRLYEELCGRKTASGLPRLRRLPKQVHAVRNQVAQGNASDAVPDDLVLLWDDRDWQPQDLAPQLRAPR